MRFKRFLAEAHHLTSGKIALPPKWGESHLDLGEHGYDQGTEDMPTKDTNSLRHIISRNWTGMGFMPSTEHPFKKDENVDVPILSLKHKKFFMHNLQSGKSREVDNRNHDDARKVRELHAGITHPSNNGPDIHGIATTALKTTTGIPQFS